MAAKKKTRHGATQPESERAAKGLLLRLVPVAERELRRRAESAGCSMSAVVTAWLLASKSNVLGVACPKCRAAVGEQCKSMMGGGGRQSTPHAQRAASVDDRSVNQ